MTTVKSNYTGFSVPEDNASIDRVNFADITPEQFYAQYIALRKPCIISGTLDDTQLAGTKQWTGGYLREHAGSAELLVERRETTQGKFGDDEKVEMTFGELLNHLDSGSQNYYLTTQDIPFEDGIMGLFGNPMNGLSEDFPERPRLSGNLVPQQVNMWLGASKVGATSGLHHDFHDNIYVLLRGHKQFTLFSPDQHASMYVYGTIQDVHENGRIVYKGDPLTRPDGLELDGKMGLTYRQRYQEYLLSKAEAELASAKDDGDKKCIAKKESELLLQTEKLEEIEDLLLTTADDEDFDGGLFDEDGVAFGDSDLENKDSDSERDSGDEADESESRSDSVPEATVDANENSGEHPKSFSQIGTVHRDKGSICDTFPLFTHAKRMVAELSTSDALYLPAGWFHEVTSQAASTLDTPISGSVGSKDSDDPLVTSNENVHTALNYWFYPPDAPNYQSPYSDGLWQYMWSLRQNTAVGEKRRREREEGSVDTDTRKKAK
ncbi:hypothetical protein SARC_00163 [Sphaeroforma arctica JP610]|uniref:JmjC domain-containing protein n=1 Tax=Sphaeroforma arctica JP610 TaxID=667725 RepID=A0A0L0GFV3_9EUKA|nr:hypothetical protein SARC_00163 [Sphaeroforma arctica JP610]KNC87729.1 hypothetical protein SARC_00163 [Sphaeroforma arctica JP610]|eukprot:XP_014161631.1 hypothetical protein SARC_00163 [Sphaeroforma arctica JP610]